MRRDERNSTSNYSGKYIFFPSIIRLAPRLELPAAPILSNNRWFH